MGRPSPETQAKRRREQAKREKREAKERKKALRKAQKAAAATEGVVASDDEPRPETQDADQPDSTPETPATGLEKRS